MTLTTRTKARKGETMYGVASKRGFPYIRGNGLMYDGTYMVRFTKDKEGQEPALYVGLEGKNWVLRLEAEALV